jgi:hypothetical protein
VPRICAMVGEQETGGERRTKVGEAERWRLLAWGTGGRGAGQGKVSSYMEMHVTGALWRQVECLQEDGEFQWPGVCDTG